MPRNNRSKKCASGPYCYLLNYGWTWGRGSTITEHDSWEDAARCEKKFDVYNDRPKPIVGRVGMR